MNLPVERNLKPPRRLLRIQFYSHMIMYGISESYRVIIRIKYNFNCLFYSNKLVTKNDLKKIQKSPNFFFALDTFCAE